MAKKSPTKPDPGEGKEAPATLTLRLPRPLNEALASYCEAQQFPPAKQVVLERLLVKFLTAEGFWPPGKGDTDTRG